MFSIEHLNTVDINEQLSLFNSLCTNALDTVAPLRLKCQKHKSEPWLNSNTRQLRQLCRRAECRWKKDRLQVSYEILRDSLKAYQRAVKTAKSQYFSNILTKNSNNPKILFKVLNSVFNPVSNNHLTESASTCENFQKKIC